MIREDPFAWAKSKDDFDIPLPQLSLRVPLLGGTNIFLPLKGDPCPFFQDKVEGCLPLRGEPWRQPRKRGVSFPLNKKDWYTKDKFSTDSRKVTSSSFVISIRISDYFFCIPSIFISLTLIKRICKYNRLIYQPDFSYSIVPVVLLGRLRHNGQNYITL